MRKLILLRGVMGAGKSTWIKQNGLIPYTLCLDDFRTFVKSPILIENGDFMISQMYTNEASKMLNEAMEQRMANGDFIIIDATHLKTSDMLRYKEKALKYRYRVYCIEFKVTLEEALKRDNEREVYKRVGEYKIRKAFEVLKSQEVPKYIHTVKESEANTVINLTPLDFSSYSKIHHIGDIHGCYTVLKDYLKEGLKENELYIFLGDYIDRGIENARVLNFIITIMNKPNVILLEGNHEVHCWNWSKNETIHSQVFENYTKLEIEGIIDKKDVRRLYRKLSSIAYYTYNDKTIIVSHGGIPCVPENLNFVSSEQFIRGVGNYDIDIDKIFSDKEKDNNVYQIHGHRNYKSAPLGRYQKSISLEGNIEFGGHLRVVTLDKNGFEFSEVKNNVYRLPEHLKMEENTETLIEILRNSEDILEKKYENISSFNFKKSVFHNGTWTLKNIKARGLFINTKTKNIVARGYEKFFNIGEMPETQFESLEENLEFPVNAYVKENGYLGLVGYDKEKNDFVFASKSTIDNDYALWLRDMFNEKISSLNQRLKLLRYLKDTNATLVFEVIDPVNDAHIIDYQHKELILLDIIKRTPRFEKLNYNDMINIANEYGFSYKKMAKVINDWTEFDSWYKEVTKEDYKYMGNNIEGFVLEDSNGYMIKIKLHYYKLWKHLRSVKTNIVKVNIDAIEDETAKGFIIWLKSKPVEKSINDIITLRNEYLNACNL
ncbi:MAG: Calcineurin-like phosphoesterase [Clostridiaceae bacterium]|jgi:predicted kinase|nr:Calcineurin-like phosphoesterase [Clostridiaceae bacterium]